MPRRALPRRLRVGGLAGVAGAFVLLYSALLVVQVYRILPSDRGGASSQAEADRAGDAAASGRGVFDRLRKPQRQAAGGGLMQPLPGLDLAALPGTLSAPLTVAPSANFTLGTWLNPARRPNDTACILTCGRTWALVVKPSGCVGLVVRRGGGGSAYEHTTLLPAPLAAWTHVLVAAKGHGLGDVAMYLNGSTTPFSVSKGQEWGGQEPGDATSLRFADCKHFNGSAGGATAARLAGTTVLDRYVEPPEAPTLLFPSSTAAAAGRVFSLATRDVLLVPAHPARPSMSAPLAEAATCAVRSPNDVAFLGVPKTGSITAMAWVRLRDMPRRKEACVLSHGSWERGWKFSITPQFNLQFTARTTNGTVRDYFSVHIAPRGDWQQISVVYNGRAGAVQFYADGFPLNADNAAAAPLGPGDHRLTAEPAVLTIGRCQAEHDLDEKLVGSIADAVLWNHTLDFMAMRTVAHLGVHAALPVLRTMVPHLGTTFALPPSGCQFSLVPPPKFPNGWTPRHEPQPPSLRKSITQLLASAVIVVAPTDNVAAALRSLALVDQEVRITTSQPKLLMPAVVLATRAVHARDASIVAAHFRHLNVTVQALPGGSGGGQLQRVAAVAAGHDTRWVLVLPAVLEPMEYWLTHLAATVLEPKSGLTATKSVALDTEGNIACAGLQHQHAVVGDASLLTLPFMLLRGYHMSYLYRAVGELQRKVEAVLCDGLLIDRGELLAGASQVPEGLPFFYQCAALTFGLVQDGNLRVSWDSWAITGESPDWQWDPGADSMLTLHELHRDAAKNYSAIVASRVHQTMKGELKSRLTLKWMFACGASWAWEASNLMEHLNRKVQLRLQIQKPFKYCDTHNVLASAAPSFSENIERMMHLPSFRLNDSIGPVAPAFAQDDIVVLHRDYFRVSNWVNPVTKRPRYLIGRYMNEVSSLHARLVEQCNALDEVWVPSQHHVDIFTRAGVEKDKIVVIPESLDTHFFDPDTVQPMLLPGQKKFVFLSNFKFEERKNWKTLVWAYCNAFAAADDVSLYIHTNLQGRFDRFPAIMSAINAYIDASVVGFTQHRSNATIPHIALVGRPLSTLEVLSLYKAANAFVLPTHGEGWGLPLHEAMAMSLPTISTAWGGNTQFMTAKNSYLIQVKEFEQSDPYDDWLRNMKWAKPDETHLSKLLREVHDRPGAARKKGLRARQDVVAMYSNAAVAERILQRLQEVQARLARAALPPAPPLDYQFQWTVASDVKLCASMRSTKRTAPPSSPPPAPPTRLADICGSSRHARLAFITPFPPRHDGLAQHAANLRTALLTRCANLQIDVFALVLDFWNGESEAYDASIVKHTICRESYSDYEAAARLINEHYDLALLNFKLGALGGTQCVFAACFAKLLEKPLATVVHSVTHNLDDPLQAALTHTLAESDFALVFSERARLELDTAVGYLPAEGNVLQAGAIHAVPHGVHATPGFPNKADKKVELGLQGKTVLLTLGYQGPDKGVHHAIRALGALPAAAREHVIYLVAGRPADCGSLCLDYQSSIEVLVAEFGLRQQVLLLNEYVSETARQALFSAADIYLALYPEDLLPHPATFYEAMAHGCTLLATPFKAALAQLPEDAGRLTWSTAPTDVSRQLTDMLAAPQALAAMQHSAWRASQNLTWAHAAARFLDVVHLPAASATL